MPPACRSAAGQSYSVYHQTVERQRGWRQRCSSVPDARNVSRPSGYRRGQGSWRHQKRHARHDRERCPAVTQDVERQPRRDLAAFARFLHWPRLLRRVPAAAVSVPEHDFAAGAAGTVMLEEIGTFRRQDHMAWLATLGFADGNGTGVRIEVLHLEPGQFAVSAARLQRRAYKRTEVGVASIEQPLCFGKVEIAHSRHFHFAERFELAAPCVTVAEWPSS